MALGQVKLLSVVVIETDDVPLFGHPWIKAFNININGVRVLSVATDGNAKQPQPQQLKQQPVVSPSQPPELQQLLAEFAPIFTGNLGKVKGHQATIHLSNEAKPKVCKARRVPFALLPGVEAEFARLEKGGIIRKVDANTPVTWASPTVNVVKKSTGAVRICGDYKVTINPYMIVDHFPLPNFEEIAAKLNGGEEFSVIDLKDAYLQLEVDEASQQYLVIATHLGYYKYLRMPMGISSGPGIWQRTINTILQGVPGVGVFIDDIIVSGKTRAQLLQNLRLVLQLLLNAGITTQLPKCNFLQPSVKYMAHIFDKTGIHPTDDKVEAICNRPMPTNVAQLRSLLGQINYYAKFIPDLQGQCAPLHRLLQQGTTWKWTDNDTAIVKRLNTKLTSNSTLVHFDEHKPLVLSCDACEYGVGAELAHILPDGSTRPVAFASRTLSGAERNYSSLDREALAIVFGVLKFHQYLYARRFTLYTDHRPLQHIFGASDTPKTAANRLQRWSVTLSAYNYDIKYRPARFNGSADSLSRLPLPTTTASPEEAAIENDTRQIRAVMFDDLPLTEKGLRQQTRADSVLQKVLQYKRHGWPEKRQLAEVLIPYFRKRDELSIDSDILLWHERVIVPETMRSSVLHALHEGHPGIVGMRSLARYYVWWPGIDKDVERCVQSCELCQQNRPHQPEVPLFSWNVANGSWDRIHIDYAGPFEGYMWLVVVCSYTKWVEIVPLKTATSQMTIVALRVMFGRWGLPRQLVSDNGAQFISNEFKQFCDKNGICHVFTTPYHPKSNGLAERMVNTFKQRFRASANNGDLQVRLQNFLLSYRNTPHASTERSPAEMFIGRRLPTVLDRIRPDARRTLDNASLRQTMYHDSEHVKPREFDVGDAVWVANEMDKGHRAGTVISRTGPLSYHVESDGREIRKHADQLRQRLVSSTPEQPMTSQRLMTSVPQTTAHDQPIPPAVASEPSAAKHAPMAPSTGIAPSPPVTSLPSGSKSPTRRYPQRTHRPPQRYSDE